MSRDNMTPHDELMALAGKATPGEWKSDASVHPDDVSVWACAPGSEEFVNNVCFDNAEADAAFIAAACNFVRSDAFRAMVRDAWQTVDVPPIKSGEYMVANAADGEVRQAKWKRNLQHWTFASAQQRFAPTHWRPLPAPPQAIDAAASGAEGDSDADR